MNKLIFYNINDDYIEYLYGFDKRVPHNKNAKRPYIGIIIEIFPRVPFTEAFNNDHICFSSSNFISLFVGWILTSIELGSTSNRTK